MSLRTHNPAKDNVFIIEEFAPGAGDEELTAIAVFAAICHGKETRGGVLTLDSPAE
jgi:hypothetical protein